MKRLMLILLVGVGLMMTSCTQQMKNIPAGYVGKILTPTGWEAGIHEAGQVDIGAENSTGSNQLVLLEVAAVNVKEQFMKDDPADHQDHRVKTKDGNPLAVDVYTMVSVPTDQKSRDALFATVTPQGTEDHRVSVISAELIYNKYAKAPNRGAIRAIFPTYNNEADVNLNLNRINGDIGLNILKIIKDSGVPLNIMNAQISNVVPDPEVVQSKNDLMRASNQVQSINMVGEAMRKNPDYLKARKYEVIEKIGLNSKSDLVLIDMNEGKSPGLNLPTK